MKHTYLLLGIVLLISGFLLGKLKLFLPLFADEVTPINPEKYTTETCIKTITEDTMEETNNGQQFWLVTKDFGNGLNLKLSEVGPQTARHAAHAHSSEEIFFILEGSAEFNLDGEKKVVPPHSSLYCPPGMLHGIRNAGDSNLRYLVIRMDKQ